MGLFLRSLLCATDRCVLPPLPRCTVYRSFIASLEVGRRWSSNFILQYFVTYLGSFASPIEFRISFVDVNRITC